MLKPRTPVRRFDVFAEYNRQKAVKEGMPPDVAEGYGLWVAKVVASRGFRGGTSSQTHSNGAAPEESQSEAKPKKPKWHMLNDKPQTDKLFHDEIVKRMGKEFYDTVFVPALEEAIQQDKSYTSIRDTIRRDWKP